MTDKIFKRSAFLTALSFCLFSFVGDEAMSHYELGMENLKDKHYVQAIGDFTNAISIKHSFGDAYYQRAKSKYLLGVQVGFFSTDLCYDLISAIEYGTDSAIDMLKEKSKVQCHTLNTIEADPDLVFCADFSSKTLTKMPVGSSKLDFMVYLNLFDNNFTSLPAEVLNYKHLIHLDMSSNKLKTISGDFSKTPYITELNFAKNQISFLPSSIFELSKLKQLYMRQNNLKSIPAEIAQLKKLEELDLSFNELTGFPQELKQMKHLKQLVLAGNSFTHGQMRDLEKALPNTKIYF
ncbi:MAG: Leucine-rich repeat (LRR) protein [Flammeovirgaceae bacterium]|jgi:Leucine-rich repeat (LRR) protein